MKLSQEYSPGANIIHAYGDNEVNINGRIYTKSLLVSHQQLSDDWPVKNINELNNTALDLLLQQQPEVIIIGTGHTLIFPQPQIYAHLINQNIGVEFMDTGAACRTYNILLSEDRRVVAGLIL